MRWDSVGVEEGLAGEIIINLLIRLITYTSPYKHDDYIIH